MDCSVFQSDTLCDCVSCVQVLSEEEKGSTEGLEDEDWDRALSVERFGDIITESGANGADKMGRSYNEKDFECKCIFFDNYRKYAGAFHNRQCSVGICAILHCKVNNIRPRSLQLLFFC